MTPITPGNQTVNQAPAGKKLFFRTKLHPSLHTITSKKFSNTVTGSIVDDVIREEFTASPQPTGFLFERGMWPASQVPAKSPKRQDEQKNLF